MGSAIVLNTLADNDAFLPFGNCDAGHDIEKIQEILIFASVNTLLNNYCANSNDNIKNFNNVKKRKLATLIK